jgi:hypothetical protein
LYNEIDFDCSVFLSGFGFSLKPLLGFIDITIHQQIEWKTMTTYNNKRKKEKRVNNEQVKKCSIKKKMTRKRERREEKRRKRERNNEEGGGPFDRILVREKSSTRRTGDCVESVRCNKRSLTPLALNHSQSCSTC